MRCPSLCFGLFFSAIDSSIVSTALVTIGSDFGDFVKVRFLLSLSGTKLIVSSDDMDRFRLFARIYG